MDEELYFLVKTWQELKKGPQTWGQYAKMCTIEDAINSLVEVQELIKELKGE